VPQTSQKSLSSGHYVRFLVSKKDQLNKTNWPFVIQHQTADGKGVVPFTPALRLQYIVYHFLMANDKNITPSLNILSSTFYLHSADYQLLIIYMCICVE